MRPLRIALLKNSFHGAGGLEKYCARLCRALQQRGHSVTILSTAAHKDLPVVQVCRRLSPSALNLIWFDLHCRRYLQSHPQDVIFGFDRHFLPLTHYRAGNGCHAAYLARRAKKNLLKRLSFALNPLHRLTLLSERRTFEDHPPLALVCNSFLVRNEIFSFYPKAPRDRIAVVHNGVEWYEYEEEFQKKISSLPNAIPQLLFIGHEWERKGLDRLLRWLAPLTSTPFHLTAVGRERRPDFFLSLVRDLGLCDRVTLIPSAKDPRPFYRMADIVVIPSVYDPFANVTLEALAMGIFVVTTRANGGAEAIGSNGIVLDEEASDAAGTEAIFEAILRGKDPAAIREGAREFDFSNKLNELVAIVESSSLSPAVPCSQTTQAPRCPFSF